MYTPKTLTAAFSLIAFSGLVYAAPHSISSSIKSPPVQPDSVTTSASLDVCPTIDKLSKQDLLWTAPGGWVSYGESFDMSAVKFIRAEWIGINVGKIICIYKGDKRYAFPIALEQKHNKMVPSPKGYHWGKDLGGRKECVSDDVQTCPFEFEKPVDHGDIYENLNFFKGKSSDDF